MSEGLLYECTHCGKKLAHDAKMCPNCGSSEPVNTAGEFVFPIIGVAFRWLPLFALGLMISVRIFEMELRVVEDLYQWKIWIPGMIIFALYLFITKIFMYLIPLSWGILLWFDYSNLILSGVVTVFLFGIYWFHVSEKEDRKVASPRKLSA